MDGLNKYAARSQWKVLLLSTAVLCFLFYPDTSGQVSFGGSPYGLTAQQAGELPVVRMPQFDPGKYLNDRHTGKDPRLKPLIFARPFQLYLDPATDGKWEHLNDGSRIWRMALHSPGAFSLNIIFSRFRLEKGVLLFIYNTDQSHVLGAFDYRNNQEHGSLAVSPVNGDMIIVEMQVGSWVKHYGDLVIGSLNHDFTGIAGKNQSRFGLSGKCNIDIACPTGNDWQNEKSAVARILINGIQLCTGILVNNTANNGTPYLITANHCIEDSAGAASSIFLFGYESPFCNGGDGPVDRSISGSALISTNKSLDFTLLELGSAPPASWQPWYAGWNRDAGVPAGTVSIHHPRGDVKKIALDHDAPVTASFGSGYAPQGHWEIERWDKGTTENGSSGSPLFDKYGYLRGVLTGGEAACGNAVNDYYSKFSLAWYGNGEAGNQLMQWLDPAGTGAISLEGINPHHNAELSAGFMISTTEICAGDMVVFTDFSVGEIDSWYWSFGEGASPPFAATRGPHQVEYAGGGTRSVSLSVAGPDGSDTSEREFGLTVKSTQIPVAGFTFTVNDLSVQFIDQSLFAENYYWEFGDKRVSSLSNPSNNYLLPGQYTIRQLVRNRACYDTSEQVILLDLNFIRDPESGDGYFRVYPVPADRYIIIETDQSILSGGIVELLSVSGRSLTKKQINPHQNLTIMDTGKYPPGIYLLRITSGGEHITKTIAIAR